MKNVFYLLLFIAIAASIYYLSQNKSSGSLSATTLTDFAISDTAGIGRMVIDDGRNVVDLKRGEGRFWTLDDMYIAMPHHIDIVLRTFHNVGVQSPVSKSSKAEVMKIILGDTRKVQIYDLQGEWLKTWYVGRSTQTNQGTYALLETPEGGLSTEPLIIEERGQRSYLTTRFHAIVKEWRWTGLFYYPELDFKQIKVETPIDPSQGYTIDVRSKIDGEFDIYNSKGEPIDIPKANVASFLGSFKAINVEHFDLLETQAQKDSIRDLPPAFRISITGKDDEVHTADIWYRPITEALKFKMGDRAPELDPERVFVYFNDGMAVGQRLTFDKILLTAKDL